MERDDGNIPIFAFPLVFFIIVLYEEGHFNRNDLSNNLKMPAKLCSVWHKYIHGKKF